jgi:hypothetical protein
LLLSHSEWESFALSFILVVGLSVAFVIYFNSFVELIFLLFNVEHFHFPIVVMQQIANWVHALWSIKVKRVAELLVTIGCVYLLSIKVNPIDGLDARLCCLFRLKLHVYYLSVYCQRNNVAVLTQELGARKFFVKKLFLQVVDHHCVSVNHTQILPLVLWTIYELIR